MDRVHLLPIQLPPSSHINRIHVTVRGKVSFVKRLVCGFIVLAGLGLLYVPAYHSAQGQLSGLDETPTPVRSVGNLIKIDSLDQLRGWSRNKSRSIRTYIRPHHLTTIINPKSICGDSPYLIIIVCSAVKNFNARMAIRNTWGNKTYLDYMYNTTVRLAFLLGQIDNVTLNSYITEENDLFKDIIQENFFDSYNNLTLKSVMLLKWVTVNCKKLTYLMKIDDDMFVNIPVLMKTLKDRVQSTGTLIGSLICNAKPIKDPKNKWYTPKYMYSERTFPNYLSGTGYVMSYDVAARLYNTALSTPLLHLEDVYITGLCAKRAGLRPINHYGFSYLPRKLEPCVLRETITTHKVNPSKMYTIWSKLNEEVGQSNTTNCSSRTSVTHKIGTVNKLRRKIGFLLLKNRIINNSCV